MGDPRPDALMDRACRHAGIRGAMFHHDCQDRHISFIRLSGPMQSAVFEGAMAVPRDYKSAAAWLGHLTRAS